jgi:hypothetical protein
MEQTNAYKIDLTKLDGKGDFYCPKCGAMISPDDETEEVYSIQDTLVDNHGLKELVIICNKCSSHIHLTGFSLLRDLPAQSD